MELEIKQLDENLIRRANSNSFNGTRGDLSAQSYKSYIDEVLSWDIPNNKKQKILEQVHKRYSKILEYEAQHVSVLVAGPANYNSRRLDKSNQVLQKSHEFYEWFDDLREQIKNSKIDTTKRDINLIMNRIEFCEERGFDPRDHLIKLAYLDNKKFIELYEKFYPKYKWR